MVAEAWGTNVVAGLHGISAATPLDLGLVYPSFKNARVDFELYQWNQQQGNLELGSKPASSPILVGECKLHKKIAGSRILRKIILLFNEFSACELFLVTALKFTALKEFAHDNYCFWKLIWDRRSPQLVQVPIDAEQDPPKYKRRFLCHFLCQILALARLILQFLCLWVL